MNIIAFILVLSGITQLMMGSWEANILNKNMNNLNDSPNNTISAFIILKSIFNIIWGLYCILLSLFLICRKKNSFDEKMNMTQNGYNCLNFGISIWGLIEYNINNPHIIHPFKQVLFIEMIAFYLINSTIMFILVSSCCFVCCIISKDLNESENTKKIHNISTNEIPITNGIPITNEIPITSNSIFNEDLIINKKKIVPEPTHTHVIDIIVN